VISLPRAMTRLDHIEAEGVGPRQLAAAEG